MTLPCISLHQPYASLLLARTEPQGQRVKIHETRHWPAPPKYIGRRIAIHAAKAASWPDPGDVLDVICQDNFGHDYRKTLPRGAFVGTVLLASSNVMPNAPPRHGAASLADFICGYWEPGRFAWCTDDPRPLRFSEAVPAIGRQGWWNVPLGEFLGQ